MNATGARHLIITVHGILTSGAWQQALEDMVTERYDDCEFTHYKRGFIGALIFWIPFTRYLETRRFANWLEDQLAAGSWERIDLVAHSFGTHLAIKGLVRVAKRTDVKINTVILAGSVLIESFRWSQLKDHVDRVVNECGEKDRPLVMSQLFVLFTGMAGRVGFNGSTRPPLDNRYFQFGHSSYFEPYEGDEFGYMREWWLPLLTTEASVRPGPPRPKLGVWGRTKGAILQYMAPLKLFAAAAVVLVFVGWIYGLWKDADIERLASLRSDARASMQRGLDLCLRDEADAGVLWMARGLERARRGEAEPQTWFSAMFGAGEAEEGSLARAARTQIGAWVSDLFVLRGLWVEWDEPDPPSYDEAVMARGVAKGAMSSSDGRIRIWVGPGLWFAVASPDELRGTPIECLRFSTDGSELYVVWANGAVGVVETTYDGPAPETIEKKDGWARVRFPGGREGWVRESHLIPVAPDLPDIPWPPPRILRKPTVMLVLGEKSGRVVADISDDGKRLAVMEVLGDPPVTRTLRVFDVDTKSDFSTPTFTFPLDEPPHDAREPFERRDYDISVDAQGSAVALAYGAGHAFLFDLVGAGRQVQLNDDHTAAVTTVGISPGGDWVISGSIDGQMLFHRDGKTIGVRRHQGRIRRVQFSPDGDRAATAATDRSARVWDLTTDDPTRLARVHHRHTINGMAFSADGQTLVTTSDDQTARVWNTDTGRRIGEPLAHRGRCWAAAINEDGYILTTSLTGEGRIWQPPDPDVDKHWAEYRQLAKSAAISPDGQHVVTGRTGDTPGRSVRLWHSRETRDLAPGIALDGDPHGTGAILTVAFGANGHRFWSGDQEGVVASWSLSERRLLTSHTVAPTHNARDGDTWAYDVAANDRLTVVGLGSGEVVLLDGKTGEERRRFMGHQNAVRCVAIGPKGRWIATGSDDWYVRVWDLTEDDAHGMPALHFEFEHPQTVRDVRFGPTPASLATGCADQVARVWRKVGSGSHEAPQAFQHTGEVVSIVFDDSGAALITGTSTGDVSAWDVATEMQVVGMTHGDQTIRAVAARGHITEGGLTKVHAVFEAEIIEEQQGVSEPGDDYRGYLLTWPIGPPILKKWTDSDIAAFAPGLTGVRLDANGIVSQVDFEVWRKASQKIAQNKRTREARLHGGD